MWCFCTKSNQYLTHLKPLEEFSRFSCQQKSQEEEKMKYNHRAKASQIGFFVVARLYYFSNITVGNAVTLKRVGRLMVGGEGATRLQLSAHEAWIRVYVRVCVLGQQPSRHGGAAFFTCQARGLRLQTGVNLTPVHPWYGCAPRRRFGRVVRGTVSLRS